MLRLRLSKTRSRASTFQMTMYTLETVNAESFAKKLTNVPAFTAGKLIHLTCQVLGKADGENSGSTRPGNTHYRIMSQNKTL